jgi:hypothetical protein
LLLLLLLLLYFGHHPISSTSSPIASSPTTDEAQPITELQIRELQWIGFRYRLPGSSGPSSTPREVRSWPLLRAERSHFGHGGKRRG